jgi:NAD-dependent DNA ligase
MTEINLSNNFSKNRLLVRSCEALIGICSGLIADGQLNDKEITFLRTWLSGNDGLRQTWPAEIIFRRIEEVMADGLITVDERQYLIQTLEDLVGGSFADTGAISTTSTRLPINNDVQIVVPEQSFCFTGQFLYATRSACERLLSNWGGIVVPNVTKKTNYLVIGELASREWKHSSHGLKIEKAIDAQNQGSNIKIIAEAQWIAAIGNLAKI